MFSVGDFVEYIGKKEDGLVPGMRYRVDVVDHRDSTFPYRLMVGRGETQWTRATDVKAANLKTICINLEDKAAAHKAVEDAIAEYNYKKCAWTEDELRKARETFEKLIAEYVILGRIPLFEIREKEKETILFSCALGENLFYKTIAAKAKAQNNDQFCADIGRVVCLCKAMKKPVPEFIRKKNTK